MRARLSAISNYTISQLLTILQNWTRDTSDIIVDGQMLTVTSVYFLSNNITSLFANVSSNKKQIDYIQCNWVCWWLVIVSLCLLLNNISFYCHEV